MIIKNGLVFTEEGSFQPMTVYTKDDVIVRLAPAEEAVADSSDTVIDAAGCYVIPGLTDVHFHGCDDYDFCDGTQEAYQAISAYELKSGITSICPATMTMPVETLNNICTEAAKFAASQTEGADLVGIHMEGPFIAPAKKGAQNGSYIIHADENLIREWDKKSGGLVKIISIAPETENAIDCIRALSKDYHFSVAHTTADYDTAKAAMDAGALHVTHLYNAMPPFTHRAPGVIGAASDTEGCMVELICDGVHIDPAVVRATFKLFGDDRVILISDSMMATGKPDGTYALGGQPVHVKGNHATLDDGTLAGSVTNLYGCMTTAVKMGIPLESAVKAATINPCRSIQIDNKYGSIRPDKKAHFLLLNQTDLSIKNIIKGQSCL